METPYEKICSALFKTYPPPEEYRQQVASRVVDYLNKVCSKHHHNDSDKSLTPVIARLSEGYNEAACKAVINKCNEMWQGKIWKGKKMWLYLRPTSIFVKDNFEKYLKIILKGSETEIFNLTHIPHSVNIMQLIQEWKNSVS